MNQPIAQKQLMIPFDPPLRPTIVELKQQAVAIYYTLNQDKGWIDIGGRIWRLGEMESSHLSNLYGYLLKHAAYFFEYYCLGEALQQDSFDQLAGHEHWDAPTSLDGFEIGKERDWILTTKLAQRIDLILTKRHVGVSFGEVIG